jgi:hypothetical protein
MATSADYQPPSSSAMKARQNETHALRLLIAQRRLYRRAKRWLAVRWIGMIIIGLAAPVVSVIYPSLAVVAGSVAGLWLFLGRTVLVLIQASITSKAAAVQEQLDFHIFGMPRTTARSTLPSLEEIAAIAGPDDQVEAIAGKEELFDWYPIDDADAGPVSVAIAQRANASYTDSLLRTTAIVWSVATASWVLVLVVVSLLSGLSLSTFLLGIALPVLPAFLDVVQYVVGVWRSARDRADLARVIEGHLGSSAGPVQSEDLLVWQDRMYELRRTAPEVPDLLYKLKRKVNERAMSSAARQLSDKAKESGQ